MELDPWEIQYLTESIRDGKCILMLGPEFAYEMVKEKPVSLTKQLAAKLCSILASDNQHYDAMKSMQVDVSNFTQVAQIFQTCSTPEALKDEAKKFFQAKAGATSATHLLLAKIPFHLIITTGADSMMENAYRSSKKEHQVFSYNVFGQDKGMAPAGIPSNPLVYHLFGDINTTEDLIFSEDDLLRFLDSVIVGKPPLPANILSSLRDPNTSLLFLGFGFKEWYLRILLRALNQDTKTNPSFAFEDFPVAVRPELKNTVFIYNRSKHKIRIRNFDARDFVAKLSQEFASLSAVMPGDAVPNDGPIVFISYASEDYDSAENVRRLLHDNGLRPWLDKPELKVGDQYNAVIKDRIEASHYFVILHSLALIKKTDSYVNVEIALALKRGERVRQPCNYIFPVLLDEQPMLPVFNGTHFLRLSGSKAETDLVGAIQKDYERRIAKPELQNA